MIVIGTPVDEHLNPDLNAVKAAITDIAEHLVEGQILVLRSTVYPGVTAMVERLVEQKGIDVDVAFCPERIAEGNAMVELYQLPQIVAARSPRAVDRATKLFRNLTHEVVFLEPEEAELAKLFTNAWRYIKFATANQLYMIANDFGLDYDRIRVGRDPELPTSERHAGRGVHRRTVLVQGHDAAGRLQQQQLPSGTSERDDQRGAPALPRCSPGAAVRPLDDDRRASWGCRSRRSRTTLARA